MVARPEPRHTGEAYSPVGGWPPYGLRKPIEVIKTAVPIEQVAAEYGEFKLQGPGRLLGRCVAQDHTDRTPSLTIYTDSGRWKCYGCGLGGDVVDLEGIAGRHADTWTAVVALSVRYGIELPGKPGSWYAKQKRQKPVRDALDEVKIRSAQRRLMRIFEPFVARIEDDAERRREAEAIWTELGDLARMMVRTAN